jgi:4-amino-4-deoxy-L-arabinose transferase-like glycosyltransferase
MTLKRSTLQFDEIAYVRMAENLAAGRGPLDVSGLTSTHFTALLPLCIAAAAMVLRNYVLSAYVVVTIFWSLITVPTYLLGRDLVNQKVGLMAAALVAVTPAFVVNAEYVYSESLYIFFLLFAIVFGRHMFRGCRVPCSTLAGASLGLAYLANPAAVYYLIIFIGLAVVVALKRGVWRHMLKALAIFLLFFSIFALPYILFLHAELGKWTYSGKRVATPIYAATNRIGNYVTAETERELQTLTDDGHGLTMLQREEDETLNNPVSFMLHYPRQALSNCLSQLTIFHNDVLGKLVPLTLLPLLGLGLFAVGWTRRGATGVGYMLLMMGPGLVNLTVLAFPRYFLVFVPMVMVWVAMGWSRLQEWGGATVTLSFSEPRASRYRRWVPWAIATAVLFPPLLQAGYNGLNQQFEVQYKEAGDWIKAETGGGTRVMREAASSYYASGTLVVFPYADYDRTTAYARYQNVDYLVIGRQYLVDIRPELSRLLGPDDSHPGWRLVNRIQPGTGNEVLIFHLEKADT